MMPESTAIDRQQVAPTDTPSRVLARVLHDDVLSEIRLSVLRLEASGHFGSPAHTELIELEHRLRLRCVEHRSVDGLVTPAELVSLHTRRLRSIEVRVSTKVNDQERLEPDRLQRLHHALSIVIDNATIAGATTIDLRIDRRSTHLELTVTDDAGGFDLADTPPGGGLATLREQWGHQSVAVRRVLQGSRVTIRVPLHTAA